MCVDGNADLQDNTSKVEASIHSSVVSYMVLFIVTLGVCYTLIDEVDWYCVKHGDDIP